MKRLNIIWLVLLIINAANSQKNIIINNTLPRKDIKGNIIDAHDGRIIAFNNKYYWYGTKYGNTNGFTNANEYVCYSSSDLTNWKFEGPLLPDKPEGVYYRPHVVFNKNTKKYVLWYNWYPQLWNGQFGVAISDDATGPFTIVNNNVSVKHSQLGVGDLGVFVDDDNKAYLSYNTINKHKVSVELLNQDYTASTLQGSEFIAEHCEAGSMFKRNNTYYLLTDYTCCFCTQGSGAQVFTAKNPLGPYKYQQNINRYPGSIASFLQNGKENDNMYEEFLAKQNNAIEIHFETHQILNQLIVHQFTGNRKGQCGEVDNPILHQPIRAASFNIKYLDKGEWKTLNATASSNHCSQIIKHTLFFNKIYTQKIRIEPNYTDTLNPIFISEISTINKQQKFTIYKTGKQIPQRAIIPAQQTHILQLQTTQGVAFIWIGDLWGSASDNVKGHDYQFWSKPLVFDNDGIIKPLEWTDSFRLTIKQ